MSGCNDVVDVMVAGEERDMWGLTGQTLPAYV